MAMSLWPYLSEKIKIRFEYGSEDFYNMSERIQSRRCGMVSYFDRENDW